MQETVSGRNVAKVASRWALGGVLAAASAIFGGAGLAVASTPPADFAFPLAFEANTGQFHSDVRLMARGRGYRVFLAPQKAVFALKTANPAWGDPSWKPLTMGFQGASPDAEISGNHLRKERFHYFKGKSPQQWHTDVPTYSPARYVDLYPSIDLVFYEDPLRSGRPRYDFVVRPGGDPRDIRLRFQGQEEVSLNDKRQLVVSMPDGRRMIHDSPVVYQPVDGGTQPVEGEYRLMADGTVGFRLDGFDAGRSLVIDPGVVFSTFLGGDDADSGAAVAAGPRGDVFVTGWTSSFDFPFLVDDTFAGDNRDVFVARLDSDGRRILYYAFLGGEDDDEGRDLAVDDEGNVYVTGWTESDNFPLSAPFQSIRFGSHDAFAAKLGPNGDSLAYSTYLGGEDDDEAHSIAVDRDGKAIVAGFTFSDDFPLFNAYQSRREGGSDIFLAQLTRLGSELEYSTYLGGEGDEEARGATVDRAGSLYITGSTFSSDFPVVNPVQTDMDGEDAVVAKVDPSQPGIASLVFSTYLGGDGLERGDRIRVDSSGKVHLTGRTTSGNFPVARPYDPFHAGDRDVFVTKLDPEADPRTAILYSTYLGDDEEDRGRDLALDARGNIYVTGATKSEDFPTREEFDPTLDGGYDVFIAMINPFETGDPSLIYSSFLGGDADEQGYGIAVDSSGSVYVVGETSSEDFRITSEALQDDLEGGMDAFLAKITPSSAGVPTVGGAAAGASEEVTVPASEGPLLHLLLSPEAVDGNGRIYVSAEALNLPGLQGTVFFRPSDEQAAQTGIYAVPAKGPDGFLPDAEASYFSQGPLSSRALDLSFMLGIAGLQGLSFEFKTWYLEEGKPFGEENLQAIQTLRVNVS